ncbi:MAG: Hsp20 family protein [Xanthomonadaceae bacterium]|nr:Hsp20 family protein [Rhodospirillaceae bacterium]NIA17838.1 Hsp20 family protein [Xanthomonadaceae bacterium]
MRLIKWNPSIGDEWGDLEKVFSDFPTFLTQTKGFTPAIDVYQDKNNVIVETPLPGVDPDKVDISIENDVLTIKGESEYKKEIDEKDYYRKEVRHGSFYRNIALPAHVLGDKADADYENGILKIKIPKAEESKPKTIKIKAKNKK